MVRIFGLWKEQGKLENHILSVPPKKYGTLSENGKLHRVGHFIRRFRVVKRISEHKAYHRDQYT